MLSGYFPGSRCYCDVKDLDPENPRCPQVVLSGRFEIVSNKMSKEVWAKRALFYRHPEMQYWPKGHNWLVAKVSIESILLVNDFGGNKYPNVTDYFKADPILHEATSD